MCRTVLINYLISWWFHVFYIDSDIWGEEAVKVIERPFLFVGLYLKRANALYFTSFFILLCSSLSSVSRHELFPIRAPLMALEHCIAPFLDSCDVDDNHRITLKEWGKCLQLEEVRHVFYCHLGCLSDDDTEILLVAVPYFWSPKYSICAQVICVIIPHTLLAISVPNLKIPEQLVSGISSINAET